MATTHKCKYMNDIFRFIEAHIYTNFDISVLSRIGHVSQGKLKNDFYSICGHPVKEYIRKRRLSNALALIKISDSKITDIAYQCGYSSHQALCRAIKQHLGLTPSEYKNGRAYYFFPPFGGQLLHCVTVSSITIPQTSCFRFYHTTIKGIEDIAVSTFLQACPHYTGHIWGRNGKQQGSMFCYELYLTGITNTKLLTSLGFEAAGEQTSTNAIYATTTVQNQENKINNAWNYLYYTWLQNSIYKYTGEPYYEQYILRNNKPYKLKLYLPLHTRAQQTQFTLIDNPGLRFITATAKGHNAEEIASQTVINFLAKNYPHVINMSKETFLQKKDNACVCGVKIDSALPLLDDECITNIYTKCSKYLVLESILGDYNQTAALLMAFTKDNCIEADTNGIFAVYDAKRGFHNLCIKMYLPLVA